MKTRELTVTSLFVALFAVGAWISIPVGAVSISLQTLFIMMAGLILPRKHGVLAVVSYLLLGLVGLPIFAGGIGGLGILSKPSVGFLVGFIPLVFISSMGQKFNLKLQFVYLIVANVILYLIGFSYIYVYFNLIIGKSMGLLAVFKIAVLPYLLGDVVKIIIVLLVYKALQEIDFLQKIRND